MSSKKLETLTPEQEALIPIVRDEWLDRFFNPKPANLPKMVEGAKWLYNLASIPEPVVQTCDSPYAAQIISNIIPMVMNSYDCILAVTGNKEWATWAGESDKVPDSVTPELVEEVRAQMMPYLAEAVRRIAKEKGDTMLGRVLNRVATRLCPIIPLDLREVAVEVVYNTIAGQKLKYYDFAYHYNAMDYHWVAFYEYFTRIGVVNHEPFNTYNDYLKAGVYESIQLRGMCTLSLMPKHIRRDAQNRLHALEQKEAAIAWHDDYKLYYVNGVYFPEDLYLGMVNGTLNAQEVLKLENAEQKTIAVKQFGYDKLLKEVGSRVIDSQLVDINGEPKVYELLEANLGDDDVPAKFVKVVCHSTGKEAMLRVDPRDKKIKDAMSAIAWTFDMPKDQYRLDKET